MSASKREKLELIKQKVAALEAYGRLPGTFRFRRVGESVQSVLQKFLRFAGLF